ncbi:MAG: hypothetical protein L0I24_24305 [Pseudonocardia sp.]|nr:hypothetical protein [Pseudonocardia sp.]
MLSLGVLAGFVVALVLQSTGRSDLARYVDPAIVALISAAFLPVPARLLTGGFREVLTMSPGPEILERLWACVREVETGHGFDESFLRASNVGGRLDAAAGTGRYHGGQVPGHADQPAAMTTTPAAPGTRPSFPARVGRIHEVDVPPSVPEYGCTASR